MVVMDISASQSVDLTANVSGVSCQLHHWGHCCPRHRPTNRLGQLSVVLPGLSIQCKADVATVDAVFKAWDEAMDDNMKFSLAVHLIGFLTGEEQFTQANKNCSNNDQWIYVKMPLHWRKGVWPSWSS